MIAPYDRDLTRAAARCFDRDRGKPVPVSMLRTYNQVLAQYHLRPESKFLNADFLDTGTTQRRHVKVESIINIGKEANRWEEQSYVGAYQPERDLEYGLAPDDRRQTLEAACKAADESGQRALAKAAGILLQHLSAVLLGKARPSESVLLKISGACNGLNRRST